MTTHVLDYEQTVNNFSSVFFDRVFQESKFVSTHELDELRNPFQSTMVLHWGFDKGEWIKTEKISADPVYSHIKNNMINQIIFSERWKEEEIELPNISCINKANTICIYLYKHYAIIPQRVNASIEGGIFILYLNSQNQRTLSIEVYNDLDVAALEVV